MIFYDAKNKIIHEIKKSNSVEEAHKWQVKYYIWLLAQHGIEGVTGILEYPKLRETTEVLLTPGDETALRLAIAQVCVIIESESCPPVINSKICKSCSYYNFCYVED